MPRQTPDAFWSCDYCGMGGFRSFDQAKAHEVEQCQQQQQPRKRQRQLRSFLLLDPDVPPPRELSMPDAVACRSLEVFEAEDSGAAYAGQVGVRCIHCYQNPTPPMAAVFPGSTDTLGSSVRMVAERHLQRCSMVPAHVREGVAASSPRNNQALMEYCSDFCRRCGIVDRMPYKTGIVFEQPQQQQQPIEDTIAATPLARRSKDNPERLQQYEEGQYAASYAQQPPQYGGQQQQQGMYAQEQQGASAGTSTPGHAASAPQQGTPHEAIAEASPHQGAYGMPSPYEMQQQQPSPGSYPFYQEPNGAWVCRYCISIHPQYRDPGSVWSTPHRTPPPGNFIDQHLSMCRAYNQSMQQQHPPMGWGGGQPPPPYPYQPGMPPPPQYGGPPPQAGWGAGASTPMHSQGLPPPYPTPEQQGMSPYYPPPDAPPHQGMMPPAGQGMDRLAGMSPPPTTPRGAAAPSDSAMRAAIDHLVASGRKFTPDPKTTEEQLVLDEDKLLLTDYFYYLMKQLRLCRFSEADRKTRGGKRENIRVGYGGLQCIHCADAPNSRKFFWSNVDRLANSFAEIPGHVLKCRRCPNQTITALAELKLRHPEQMSRLPRGSQKVFFRRMWRRLHDSDPQPESEEKPAATPVAAEVPSPEESKASTSSSSKVTVPEGSGSSPGTSGDDSTVVVQRATGDAAKALAASMQSTAPPSPSSRILLAIAEDKEWLSDMDCFIRKQLEVFCANEDDVQIAQTDRKYPVSLGQVGIRCIHCALSKGARGNAVAYPYSISGIYESVREFQRLHLESCPNLPQSARVRLGGFKGSASLSSVLRKYYVLASKALGMYDTPDGIRSGAESVPLGSSAAFAFSESSGSSTGRGTNVSEQMRSSDRSFMDSGPAITPLESRKRKNHPSSDEQASKKVKEESSPEEKESSS